MARPPSPRPWSQIAALTGIYFVQGVGFGYLVLVVLASMTQSGVPLESRAQMLALGAIPWVGKFAIAALLDRWRSLVSPRAVAAVALGVVGLLFLGWAQIDLLHSELWVLTALWLATHTGLAIADVAADGWALDEIPSEHRGAANGFMHGALELSFVGVGGLGLGRLADAWGMDGGFVAVAVVAIAVAGAIAPRQSPRGTHDPSQVVAGHGTLATLRQMTASGRAWALALVVAVLFVGEVATSTVSQDFLFERVGLSAQEFYGSYLAVYLGAQAFGFIAAAFAADKVGHARAAAIAVFVLGGLWVGFATVHRSWDARSLLYAFVIAETLTRALLYVGLHALLMDAVEPRFRTTHYALFMALLNSPRAWVPIFASSTLAELGFVGIFAACGVLQCAVGTAFLLVRKRAGSLPPTAAR